MKYNYIITTCKGVKLIINDTFRLDFHAFMYKSCWGLCPLVNGELDIVTENDIFCSFVHQDVADHKKVCP